MRPQQNRFIRSILARLKRQYGVPIKVVRRTKGAETDFATGRHTYLYDAFSLVAIVLPTRERREDEYKLFETRWSRGAFFDTSVRSFYMDRADVEFAIAQDDYIILENRRYDVVEVNDFEETRGYIVIAKEVKDAPLFNVFEVTVTTDLLLDEAAGGVL